MISKKFSKLEKNLYIGFDDSNHAGHVKKEIIVGIFSSIPEDNVIQKFPKRRDFKKVRNWMKNHNRDYRFTTLDHDFYFRNNYNLPLTAIYLVEDYLKSVKNKDFPTQISLNFDGLLKINWRKILESDFSDFGLTIKNFKEKEKRNCPKLIYMADVFSNNLFKTFIFEKISKNKRFVIPPREIYERERLFQN